MKTMPKIIFVAIAFIIFLPATKVGATIPPVPAPKGETVKVPKSELTPSPIVSPPKREQSKKAEIISGQKNDKEEKRDDASVSKEGVGASVKVLGFEINVSNVHEYVVWVLIALFVIGFLFYAFKPKSHEAKERAAWVAPLLGAFIMAICLLSGFVLGVKSRSSETSHQEHIQSLPDGAGLRLLTPRGGRGAEGYQTAGGGSGDWGGKDPGPVSTSQPPIIVKYPPSLEAKRAISVFHWYVATGLFILASVALWILYTLVGRVIQVFEVKNDLIRPR
jgi:hypothetical protein